MHVHNEERGIRENAQRNSLQSSSMSELSIEIIEAMSPENIVELKTLAKELHEATPELVNTPLPPQEYERQEGLRAALGRKLQESLNYLDGKIHDLEALKRDIRSVKSYCGGD